MMLWAGIIPARTDSAEILTTLDFLTTFASLAGAELPQERILDGKDITSLLNPGSDGLSESENIIISLKINVLIENQKRSETGEILDNTLSLQTFFRKNSS